MGISQLVLRRKHAGKPACLGVRSHYELPFPSPQRNPESQSQPDKLLRISPEFRAAICVHKVVNARRLDGGRSEH
jgi:hypothetical protein